MKRVVVTGGSGKAGRAVVRDLVEHDYHVVNLDVVHPAERLAPTLIVDLTDFGQTIEALRGAEAVVHLAAIPAPGMRTVEQTFRINMTSTWNVFSAAAQLKLERVVWASSETVLGLPFGALHARNLLDDTATTGPTQPPDYAPIDEAHPLRPNSSYSLSKVLSEEMARQFARWTGIPFVGLRFSNIMEPPDYETFPTVWKDPHLREWNLWGYVDTRDVAQASRLGLTADISGAEAFIIAAADTVMNRPSNEVMAEFFPGVALREGADGTKTLLAIDKARTMLGYAPAHSWRDAVPAPEPASTADAPAAAAPDALEAR
jgi:nucleoside-diphosphate-sugar epimerase